MAKNRNQKSVITDVSKKQDANASITKKLRKDISVRSYKLVIWLALAGVIGGFLGSFFGDHKSQKVLEKQNEINLHDKEELYKRNLDLQLKVIEDLKQYKVYILDNNEGIISTSEIDSLISAYIVDFKTGGGYHEIMPQEFEYFSSHNSNFQEGFEKHLSRLEDLAERFSYSFGVNECIKNELSNKKEIIEEEVKDTKILNRVWKLEDTCSNNLKEIEDTKLAD